MIEARFTSEMRNILKSLKDGCFIGYSTSKFYTGETIYDGEICLHVGDKTIKISNKEKRIPWFKNKDLSELEEIFSFSCEETLERGEENIAINESIEKIKIITDYIRIPQKNYEIALDMALIIVTKEHKYLISRGWQFGEYLDINVDGNFDDIYPLKQVVEEWNNFGEWVIDVQRVVQEL